MSTDMREFQAKTTCLYTQEQVNAALDKIAAEMNIKLKDKNPILICMVLGAIVPFGNLLPRLNFLLEIDYMHVTRYGHNTTGADEIKWKAVPAKDLANRTVVIVDDILDEGLTLAPAIQYCKDHGAKEVLTAVMLDKKRPRALGGMLKADFTGLEIEDKFVIGYGLDYQGYLRNMPGIYVAGV